MANLRSQDAAHKERLIILFLFFAAILLRFFYFSDFQNTNEFPFLNKSDSHCYFTWAKDIAAGKIIPDSAFMKWPLYAYLLAVIFKIFGSKVALIFIIQIILGALNCILLYLISKKIFNRFSAIVASLLYLSYAMFYFYEGLLVYTTFSLSFGLLFFLLLLHSDRNSSGKKIFSLGLLLGVGTLMQPLLTPAAVLATIWKIRGKKFLFFFAGLLLLIFLPAMINYRVEKKFIPLSANLGINFYVGNNPEAKGGYKVPVTMTQNQEDMFRDARIIAEAEVGQRLTAQEASSFWLNKAAQFFISEPLKAGKLLLLKWHYVFSPQELTHDIEYHFIDKEIGLFKMTFKDLKFIMPFALIGMLICLPQLKRLLMLYIFIFVSAFGISLFFVASRYRVMLVPFLIIFSACAICSLFELLRNKKWKSLIAYCVTALIFFLLPLKAQSLQKAQPKDERGKIMEDHLMQANYFGSRKEYANEARELLIIRELYPEDPRILIRLGESYYHLNKLGISEDIFKQVVAINPLAVDAYYNLGFLYNLRNDYAQAKEMLEKAVGLDPFSAQAHFELGVAYKNLGRKEEAKEEFLIALKYLSPWDESNRKIVFEEMVE